MAPLLFLKVAVKHFVIFLDIVGIANRAYTSILFVWVIDGTFVGLFVGNTRQYSI